MTKFFNNFKKYSFFGHFFFSKNPAFSRTTLYGFLTPFQNFEETKDPNSKKGSDKGRKAVQIMFYGTLPSCPDGPIAKRTKLINFTTQAKQA